MGELGGACDADSRENQIGKDIPHNGISSLHCNSSKVPSTGQKPGQEALMVAGRT